MARPGSCTIWTKILRAGKWGPCGKMLKFGFKHKDDFEKMAVVGGPKWAVWGTKLFAHFMEGQVKVFAPEELQAAWDWLEA